MLDDIRKLLAQQFGGGRLVPLAGRGNSQVGIWQGDKNFFVKFYPQDASWDRRATEASVLQAYARHGIDCVPDVLFSDARHNLTVFSFLEGSTDYVINDDAFQQFHRFVERFLEIDDIGFTTAKEGFFETLTLWSHISNRFQFLSSISDDILQNHLKTVVSPVIARLERLADATPFSTHAIISPSDFGTHNSLRSSDGTLRFIDFEYGGRDTKFKLLTDFYWHPGNRFSLEQRRNFVNAFVSGSYEAKVIRDVRLLMGLKWALLVLNEFIPGVIDRRRKAGLITHSDADIKTDQLQKSIVFLDQTLAELG